MCISKEANTAKLTANKKNNIGVTNTQNSEGAFGFAITFTDVLFLIAVEDFLIILLLTS